MQCAITYHDDGNGTISALESVSAGRGRPGCPTEPGLSHQSVRKLSDVCLLAAVAALGLRAAGGDVRNCSPWVAVALHLASR
jgi:hypothetical protein